MTRASHDEAARQIPALSVRCITTDLDTGSEVMQPWHEDTLIEHATLLNRALNLRGIAASLRDTTGPLVLVVHDARHAAAAFPRLAGGSPRARLLKALAPLPPSAPAHVRQVHAHMKVLAGLDERQPGVARHIGWVPALVSVLGEGVMHQSLWTVNCG